MIKTMPVWTLAIALMAVTASPSNAQSKTPVSSGSATNSIINESTLRQPNAIYSSFGQSSSVSLRKLLYLIPPLQLLLPP